MIKHYVTFEQAKWLKEKGFNEPTVYHYSENPVNNLIVLCEPDDPQFVGHDWQPNNWNVGYVMNKWSAPEQHLVVEWLRVNHGIWIGVLIARDWVDGYNAFIESTTEYEMSIIGETFGLPEEAYRSAFDYIIKNNLI
jgi:hypothetical protein